MIYSPAPTLLSRSAPSTLCRRAAGSVVACPVGRNFLADGFTNFVLSGRSDRGAVGRQGPKGGVCRMSTFGIHDLSQGGRRGICSVALRRDCQ